MSFTGGIKPGLLAQLGAKKIYCWTINVVLDFKYFYSLDFGVRPNLIIVQKECINPVFSTTHFIYEHDPKRFYIAIDLKFYGRPIHHVLS